MMEKDQFTKRNEYFRKFRDNPYQIIRIPLDNARINWLIPRAGDLVKIVHASSDTAQIDIRLNYVTADLIEMRRYRKIETFFKEIYVTNAAQPDEWVDLLVAVKEWFDITDFFFRVAAGGGFGLPWTGQITVYQNGDDGFYQKGYTLTRPIVKGAAGNTRFVDNLDGTVTDLATGLMFVQDPFTDIPVFGVTSNWANAIINCEALNFAGYNDWRLPNVKELMSIVDYGSSSPAIDAPIFPNCKSDFYWTSTTLDYDNDYAFEVYFGTGRVLYSLKTTATKWTRPVRAGLPL